MQKLLDRLKASSGVIDVYDLIDRFQLDLVSQVFLGESTKSLSAAEQPFRKAMEELLTYNTNRLLFGYVKVHFHGEIYTEHRARESKAPVGASRHYSQTGSLLLGRTET